MGAILFIPVLLLMAAIGTPTRTNRQSSSTTTQEDYGMHLPLLKVPPEYHEAYALYLKSPEWRSLKKLVLERDKYCCVDCGARALSKYNPDGKPLQVHHIHYDGVEAMTFAPEQCVSVCHDCHAKRHGRDRI